MTEGEESLLRNKWKHHMLAALDIPISYIDLLKTSNGGVLRKNLHENERFVARLRSVESITTEFLADLPKGYWPFADDLGGNHFVLYILSGATLAVGLLDHEDLGGDVIFVDDSMDVFFSKLSEEAAYEESEIILMIQRGDDDGVISLVDKGLDPAAAINGAADNVIELAAQYKRSRILEELDNRGVDLQLAIEGAPYSNDDDWACFVFDKYADIAKIDISDNLLFSSALCDVPEFCTILLKLGYPVTELVISNAVCGGSDRVWELLNNAK